MPRRKVGATEATQNAEDDESAFEGEGMDLDDAGEDAPPRKEKGATSRRSGATAAASLGPEEIDKKVGDLCRLALFTEYRRGVLKREDINKKVMGGNNKAFPEVFTKANKRLKNALGYEIVELLPRAEREKTLLGGKLDEDGEPKKKGASAKQYIVRSTLDPALIQAACTVDEDIQAQEEEDAGEDGIISGCILAWQIHDQIPAYGTLCVILSLILVNGKTIPDANLRSQLKKLRLTSSSIIDIGTVNGPKKLTLEQYLTLVVKQGYLDRIKVGNTASVRTGGKRGRGGTGAARVDGEEGTVDLEWRWGERSHAEISEKGISDFVVSFMTEQSRPVGNVQESGKAKKDRLERVQKQLQNDIKRAAQSELTQIEGDAPEA